VGGFLLGLYLEPVLERWLVPEGVAPGLGFALTLALGLGAVAAGMALGLALALLLSAPLLEALTRRVEPPGAGAAATATSLRWELVQSFRAGLYFVAAAPIALLLSLLPLVGPLLGLLWGAYALAFQQTDWALTRRGLDFAARRAWHRQWRAESLGFGLAGMITLVVPFANLLLAPVLAVGGTLLVRALDEEAAAAPE
jgi:CysZ protein